MLLVGPRVPTWPDGPASGAAGKPPCPQAEAGCSGGLICMGVLVVKRYLGSNHSRGALSLENSRRFSTFMRGAKNLN